jgi:hypothetical protein
MQSIILDIKKSMDPTTTSSANSGFVGIKFCQEWFVKIRFIYLNDIFF